MLSYYIINFIFAAHWTFDKTSILEHLETSIVSRIKLPHSNMASLLGAQYDSSSDDDMGTAPAQSNPTPAIVAAPDVPVEVWSSLVILLDLMSII